MSLGSKAKRIYKMPTDPCSVCGPLEEVGNRSGARVCIPCYDFFHRHYIDGDKARCSSVIKGTCEITKLNRSCIFCRLQKCLEVGM